MKKILFFLIPVLIAGCNKQETIKIHGTVPDAEGKYLVLEKIEINTPISLDSVKIKKSGNFKLEIPVSEPDFYQLSFSNRNFVSLLGLPGENIGLKFKTNDLSSEYEVTGSEGSILVQQLDVQLRNTLHEMDSITELYRSNIDSPGFDSLSVSLNDSYNQLMLNQRKFLIGFILNNLSSLSSIKALYQKYNPETYILNDIKDYQYLKLVTDTLSVYYPDSKHTKALGADFEKGLARVNMARMSKLVNESSIDHPDIALPTPEGDTISLSSLRGNYVLLTFWASWNQESVDKNLQLKSFYNKYKSKGFKIYQVSFDNKKENWENAIRYDELPWINVSDLKYPESTIVGTFNVQKIPMNYFVEKDGTLSARDLDNRTLKIKLEQVFGF
ncbi:MAG: TlpA disulfide reductase family protein [Bacteroidales bacterium]|nr:TlpA disulfide reductase family protein [Bacteroidales bacterium]